MGGRLADLRARLAGVAAAPRARAATLLAVLALMALGSARIVLRQADDAAAVGHTLQVENRVGLILSMLQDAEIGQRGYLLTGEEHYLEPYAAALGRLPAELDALDQATADNPRQTANIAAARPLVAMKLSELRQTIDMRRAGDAAGALAVVRGSAGKIAMDGLREVIALMRAEEEALLASREAAIGRTRLLLHLGVVGAAVLGLGLASLALGGALGRARAAEAARDSLAARLERRLAAILAADVVGYSGHMERDEAATLATLTAHRRLAERIIAEAGGRVTGTAGDGLLAAFGSVAAAVDSGLAIQRGIAAANAALPPGRRLEMRVGVNVGDVMVQDGDVFGDSVNVAARLESLADPGGVCVSRAVRDHLRKHAAYGFEDQGFRVAKNIARPIRVFRVREAAPGEAAPASAPASAA